MRNMLMSAAWLSSLLFFPVLHCAQPMSAGGSSSETVIGMVVNNDGSPACSTVVTLYPADYDPIHDAAIALSALDTTDAAGAYSLEAPTATVHYSIVATKRKSGTRALICGITLNGDTTRAQDAVLSAPGAIMVTAPDTADIVNGYMYIPGTGIAVLLNGGRKALFDQVPAGSIVSVNYASRASLGTSIVFAAGIEVVSSDTTIVAFPQWGSSKRLYINTTASGAGVSGTVVNFPVIVRLTSGNFDFGRAKNDGGDIRFTKSNGAPLPYEIERWDPVARQAEVWIKIDTVYGNDSTHYVTMLWGNSSATGSSSGAAVFDTAHGFQGVWHLNETGNSLAKDATGNHFDGTPSDTAPAGAEGMVGPCRSFNGSSNGIRMNGTANSKLNFQENGIYAISGWAYTDTLDIGYHMIAGKGNEQYFLGLKRSNPDTTMRWEFVEYHDKEGWQITQEFPSAKTWTHLVGVRKGAIQYLYVNGRLADSTIEVTPPIVSRNMGNDVSIGKFLSVSAYEMEGKCPFLGKIDEVRIENVAPSADWIKLCYMNQKSQDALVEFK